MTSQSNLQPVANCMLISAIVMAKVSERDEYILSGKGRI